jgi:hypothetical protein
MIGNNVMFRFIVGVLHPRQAIEVLLYKANAFCIHFVQSPLTNCVVIGHAIFFRPSNAAFM